MEQQACHGQALLFAATQRFPPHLHLVPAPAPAKQRRPSHPSACLLSERVTWGAYTHTKSCCAWRIAQWPGAVGMQVMGRL